MRLSVVILGIGATALASTTLTVLAMRAAEPPAYPAPIIVVQRAAPPAPAASPAPTAPSPEAEKPEPQQLAEVPAALPSPVPVVAEPPAPPPEPVIVYRDAPPVIVHEREIQVVHDQPAPPPAPVVVVQEVEPPPVVVVEPTTVVYHEVDRHPPCEPPVHVVTVVEKPAPPVHRPLPPVLREQTPVVVSQPHQDAPLAPPAKARPLPTTHPVFTDDDRGTVVGERTAPVQQKPLPPQRVIAPPPTIAHDDNHSATQPARIAPAPTAAPIRGLPARKPMADAKDSKDLAD